MFPTVDIVGQAGHVGPASGRCDLTYPGLVKNEETFLLDSYVRSFLLLLPLVAMGSI